MPYGGDLTDTVAIHNTHTIRFMLKRQPLRSRGLTSVWHACCLAPNVGLSDESTPHPLRLLTDELLHRLDHGQWRYVQHCQRSAVYHRRRCVLQNSS